MRLLTSFSVLVLTASLFVHSVFGQSTAAELFAEASDDVAARRYEAGIEKYRRGLALEKNNFAAHFKLGVALMIVGRRSEGITSLREAARLRPTEGNFRTALCQALSEGAQHDAAIIECRKGVELDTASERTHLGLISALLHARRFGDAAAAATVAIQKFPDSFELKDAGAEAFSKAGDIDRALELLRFLADQFADSAIYQIRLAENYLVSEQDAAAMTAARRAIELEPSNAVAHFYVGKIFLELAQYEDAAVAFQKAAVLGPERDFIQHSLAIAERNRGNRDQALVAIRKAIEIGPDDPVLYNFLGSLLIDASKYREAVVPFREAVKLDPNNFEAYAQLGLVLFESGQYDDGLVALQKADSLKPGHEIVQMFLRVARSRQQDFSRLEEMKAFAEKNPENAKVRISLIQLLSSAQRHEEAETYFRELVAANSSDAKTIEHLAVTLSSVGMHDRSRELEMKLIAIDPSYAAPYFRLAVRYHRDGKFAEADEAFKKFLERKADAKESLIFYANFLVDTGRRREAFEVLKRAHGLMPTNSTVLSSLTVLAGRLNEKAAALQYYELLKAVDPGFAAKAARCLRFWGLIK